MKTKNFDENNNLFPNENYIITKKNQDIQYNINKRNYGIDLLRIISMIKIIILHLNLFSGYLKLNFSSPKYKKIWRLEIFSYPAVNCFGLISGYVGYKKYKFANLIYLWVLVFFYSMGISSYLFFFTKNGINKKNFILSLFPILIKRHWYVNAYFLMYLLLPFINYGILLINKNLYRNLVIFILIFYLSHYTITKLLGIKNNTFLNDGYSTMWLLLLYIIGGYLGKYANDTKKNNYLFLFLLLYIISFFFNSEIHFKLLRISSKIPNKIFINYISPTTVIQAISLIIVFSNLKIENKFLIKIISFLTPLNFSAQLIHARLFRANLSIIKIFFNYIIMLKIKGLFYKIFGIGIIIYIICICIDYIRFLIFKLLKIKKFCLFIEKIFPDLLDKFFQIFKI